MKSLAALVASLSLTCSIAGSAMADADGGAKGLFFEQLSRPADSLNTGIQYWIELHHDGKTIHATNKTAFHTGDKIRFHVRPNIDGYAYIMLRSGSKGESAVLFPEKGRSEDNKITRGKEMVLPNDGTFGFDENPGVEKLTLLISRTPINADNYISGSSSETAPKMVAMASSGSKDLIPNQVLVSYLPNAVTSAVPDAVKAAMKTTTTKTTTKPVVSTTTKTAPVASTTKTTRYNHKLATGSPSAPSETTKELTTTQTTSKKGERTASVVHVEKDDAHKSELVTVVYKNPNGVLAADISLEHKE